MKGLLSGLRILDLTRMLAGPYGTMIFWGIWGPR
jgi:crotonobetainyl-CoA:carnitine CoA-transferase CaiB-like acyl-CoA transferase